MKNEIIIFEKDNVKLEVNMKDETVWLTQAQMAELFDKSRNTITEHINNVFKEKELEIKSNVGFSDFANSDKPVKVYSLDVVISVGYRVKSKRGTEFRIWANKILKNYLLKGYAINEKRMQQLEKTIKLIDIANRNLNFNDSEANTILKVIGNYSKGLDLLDNYDHRDFNKIKGNFSDLKITYEACLDVIYKLKFNDKNNIFGIEKDMGLKSIIDNIYQTFDGDDVYKSIEEKAANLLYIVVKDHVFVDGNKRIAATLFIYFLNYYGILYKNDELIIENNTLAALTILLAESNPKEKELMIDLILNIVNF